VTLVRALCIATVAVATSCAPEPPGHPLPTPAAAVGIDQDTLREARWQPLNEAASGGREVIRVASVLGLVERVYVEIDKSGSDVTLEVGDAIGNRMKRRLPPDAWARLAKHAQVLRVPIDEKKAERHYRWIVKHSGYCHGWDQIETALAGQKTYVATTVCLGDAAKERWEFAEEVIAAALALFPECGTAPDGMKAMEHLFLCPTEQAKKGRSLSGS
jgi:hypothetical protein